MMSSPGHTPRRSARGRTEESPTTPTARTRQCTVKQMHDHVRK